MRRRSWIRCWPRRPDGRRARVLGRGDGDRRLRVPDRGRGDAPPARCWRGAQFPARFAAQRLPVLHPPGAPPAGARAARLLRGGHRCGAHLRGSRGPGPLVQGDLAPCVAGGGHRGRGVHVRILQLHSVSFVQQRNRRDRTTDGPDVPERDPELAGLSAAGPVALGRTGELLLLRLPAGRRSDCSVRRAGFDRVQPGAGLHVRGGSERDRLASVRARAVGARFAGPKSGDGRGRAGGGAVVVRGVDFGRVRMVSRARARERGALQGLRRGVDAALCARPGGGLLHRPGKPADHGVVPDGVLVLVARLANYPEHHHGVPVLQLFARGSAPACDVVAAGAARAWRVGGALAWAARPGLEAAPGCAGRIAAVRCAPRRAGVPERVGRHHVLGDFRRRRAREEPATVAVRARAVRGGYLHGSARGGGGRALPAVVPHVLVAGAGNRTVHRRRDAPGPPGVAVRRDRPRGPGHRGLVVPWTSRFGGPERRARDGLGAARAVPRLDRADHGERRPVDGGRCARRWRLGDAGDLWAERVGVVFQRGGAIAAAAGARVPGGVRGLRCHAALWLGTLPY